MNTTPSCDHATPHSLCRSDVANPLAEAQMFSAEQTTGRATIALSDILVFPKQSTLQWNMTNSGLSEKELLAQYSESGIEIAPIMEGHQAHLDSLERVKRYIPAESFIDASQHTKEELSALVRSHKLIIALGGDNHLTHIAQHLTDQLLIGINSDSERSHGALTEHQPREIQDILEQVQSGNYVVQEWARLEIDLMGKRLPLALNDIYLGTTQPQYCSKGELQHNEKTYSLKGAGLLVSTGTGSTGWMRCASRYLFPEGHTWPRTAQEAYFLERDPFTLEGAPHGKLSLDEKLTVHSTMNHGGQVVVDSGETFTFNRGAVAEIGISDTPLRVAHLE